MTAPGAPVTPAAYREPGRVGVISGLDLVLFRWGLLRLAVPASQIAGLGPDSDPEAPAVGDLLELAAATSGTDREPAAPARFRRLALRGAGLGEGLRVQEPVDRVRLEASAIQPLPPLIAARLRLPLVRALASPGDPAGAIILILDLLAAGSRRGSPRPEAPIPCLIENSLS